MDVLIYYQQQLQPHQYVFKGIDLFCDNIDILGDIMTSSQQ